MAISTRKYTLGGKTLHFHCAMIAMESKTKNHDAQFYKLFQVWTVRLEIISLANETERLGWREKLGEVLCEKTLYICEVMNKDEFVPKMPNQSDLDLVFDSNFHDVQPHLFKVCHSTANVDTAGVTGVNTVRRLLKDTLAI